MKNVNGKILFRPKVAIGILFSAVLSSVVFQNCSKGVLQDSTNNTASSFSQTKASTVGVVTTRQVYNSILNVTKSNIGISSVAPGDLANLSASISNTGDPNSVNGPMWMAVTSLSGLGCVDVLANDAKAVKAGKAPNFIVNVNLWATPPAVTDSQIQDTVNRFGRAFWGRNPTADESATILAAMTASFSDIRTVAAGAAGNPTKDAVNSGTNRMMFFLCTAMLSSMDTHKRITSN
jgi:hypothetical protein